jgi:hypothetical protein
VEVVKGHFQDAFGNGNARGFLNTCASSWKKNQASKNVVPDAMNRQVNALSKWRILDFLGLGMLLNE